MILYIWIQFTNLLSSKLNVCRYIIESLSLDFYSTKAKFPKLYAMYFPLYSSIPCTIGCEPITKSLP